MCSVLLVLMAGPSVPVEGQGAVRLSLGAEFDTNPRRALPTLAGVDSEPAARSDIVGDGLARMLVDARGTLRLGEEHWMSVSITLGSKRFVAATTEDLLVQDFALQSEHGLVSTLVLSTFAEGRWNRMRSGVRDYDALRGGFGLGILLDALEVRTFGGGDRFALGIDRRFNNLGVFAGVNVAFRPMRRWSFDLRGAHQWRFYEGNGLVMGEIEETSETVLTFCQDRAGLAEQGIRCRSEPRRDGEWQGSLFARYRGTILVGELGYSFRGQRSSSSLENVDRHRLQASATLGLPWALQLSALGAIQVNQGVSITDNQLFAEDDENQNVVQVQVHRELTEALAVDARWSWYNNQFGTTDVSFDRQTFYLGVSVAAEPR